ncbi:hypothetical protein D9M72_618550 [compost metagenome]
MIEYEEDFCNDETVAGRRNLRFRESHQFRNDRRQRLFALVNRYDDGNTMGAGRRACHCIGHVHRVYRFGDNAV